MPGELVIIERQLQAVRPRLEAALGGIMPSTRLEQTILVSCERTPELLGCSPQSVLNAAMTFAVLGLPVDGATGQGYLIPFKKQAQPVIGYKGYNTLGARAGLTITADHVREDDEFSWELGTNAFVRHRKKLGSQSRIVAFWACATANDRPPIVAVLSFDDVMAVKAKSPGKDRAPWNDPAIGFPAMGEKTARRRLARSTPLRIDMPQFQYAARMEEAFDEQGKLAWVTPSHGVVVEGEPAGNLLPARNTDTPTAEELLGVARPQETPQPLVEGYSKPLARSIPDHQVETFLINSATSLAELGAAWKQLTPRQQHLWTKMKDLHFKPMAEKAEKERA